MYEKYIANLQNILNINCMVYPSITYYSGVPSLLLRGPEVTKDLIGMISLVVLLEYLTESSVSPLQAAFVESPDPLGRA